ncbi:uncharacterized protein LOC144326075 [Podarcis muralis]
MVCKACTETLRGWTNGKRSLNFGIPMVWREPTNHVTDCYFCAVDVTGINRKNWSSLKYPDLQSAHRPVAHCDEIPVPIFGELPDISDEDASSVEGHEEEVVLEDDAPHPFSQKELNDLVRDLSLSKDSAELLASRLKEKNLSDSACISFFRNRHQEYLRFFSEEKDLVYCADIAQLLLKLGVPQYEPKDWRLFIDSSKRSLKCVLLNNGNQYRCFLCMWDSRDRAQHYTKKDWPVREELVPCKERNVFNDPLVDRDRILFPPLQIKLGLIKQFTKALDKDGD